MGSYSSDSEDSSSRGKKVHSRRRSRGRSSSYRSKHSSSRHSDRSPSSRYRSRRSRSHSRDRRRSNSRDRSRHSKYKRSRSRDVYRKRSRSREDRRERKSEKRSRHRKRSSSRNRSSRRSSSSSSSDSTVGRRSASVKESSEKALRDKLLETIKAASGVDARIKEPVSSNDFDFLPPIKPDPDQIKSIEEDYFAPKTFKSSKIKEEVSDIKPPVVVERKIPEKTVFHSSFFEDSQEKMDRWVKKLFLIRQRALSGGSPQ